MEVRSLKFVNDACGGTLLRGSPGRTVRRVCTDSRKLQADDLFWAIKGENFDGHDFVAEAAGKGAAAVVVDRDWISGKLPACAVIAVEDPRRSLGLLAAAYRQDFTLPVIAVGGSNGKTTTKELIASVLRQKLATLWSEASFNNDLGVPLTLLRLESTHAAAVLEAGTNHPGELAPLVEMIRPQFGVLTSIGREHLEFFRDLAGVVREEGALGQVLPAGGKLFLNGDSEWAAELGLLTKATVVCVGLGGKNDWRARNVRLDAHGVSFRVGQTSFPSRGPV